MYNFLKFIDWAIEMENEYLNFIDQKDRDTKRVVSLIDETHSLGITILPPDVNTSKADFAAIDETTISYGLAAIKKVGYKVSKEIANEREKNGNYSSIFAMSKYFSSGVLNKKTPNQPTSNP